MMRNKLSLIADVLHKYRLVFRISLIVFFASLGLFAIETLAMVAGEASIRASISAGFDRMGGVIGASGAVSAFYFIASLLLSKFNISDSVPLFDHDDTAEDVKAAAAKLNAKAPVSKSDKS